MRATASYSNEGLEAVAISPSAADRDSVSAIDVESGIQTCDIRHAIFCLRDITQRCRPLGLHSWFKHTLMVDKMVGVPNYNLEKISKETSRFIIAKNN